MHAHRLMTSGRAGLLAVAVTVLVAPASAGAATVSVRKDTVVLSAGDGRDRVTVTHSAVNRNSYQHDSDTLKIRDRTARLRTSKACRRKNAHTVICRRTGKQYSFVRVRAELGGGADSFKLVDREGTLGDLLTDVTGGAGNDTLTGGPSEDRLDGGPGADVLRGGGDRDTLIDGEPGAAGHDTFDGGAGRDLLSYATSAGPVRVDLAAGGGSDATTGVEDVEGSPGADTLTGSDARNVIAGGAGADTIDGAGGDDSVGGDRVFYGDPEALSEVGDDDADADTVTGGDGDDLVDVGGTGTGTCGAGSDIITRPAGAAPVDCEQLQVDTDDFGTLTIPSQPRARTATSVTLGLACPLQGDPQDPVQCDTGVILTAGGVTLGTGSFDYANDGGEGAPVQDVSITLTPAGADFHGVATVQLPDLKGEFKIQL